LQLEQLTEIEVQLRQVGLQADSLPVVSDRDIQLAADHQGPAELAVCESVLGIKLYHATELLDGLVQFALDSQHLRHVVTGRGVVRVVFEVLTAAGYSRA